MPIRRLIRAGVAVAALHLAAPGVPGADAQPSKEYQIKAVFLFNFTQFVQWPASAFTTPEEPLIIAVVGENPFGRALDDAVKGERVENRPIVVQHVTRAQDLKACHVLFVSAGERANAEKIIAAKKGQPVLTVGDGPGFIERGGMVTFYLDGSKIRFEIDPAAAQRAGLKPASQLLHLAKISTTEGARRVN